jgi:hypothetical protein
MTKRRMMGELIFLNGKDEAQAAGAKLVNAGFGFVITDDVDDEVVDEFGNHPPTAFVMVWLDYHPDALKGAGSEHALAQQFCGRVRGIIDQEPDNVGLVASDLVPTFFGDFGEKTDPLLIQQRAAGVRDPSQ